MIDSPPSTQSPTTSGATIRRAPARSDRARDDVPRPIPNLQSRSLPASVYLALAHRRGDRARDALEHAVPHDAVRPRESLPDPDGAGAVATGALRRQHATRA